MEIKRDNNKVLLELSDDEALVLIDWLFRFNENDNYIFFEDQAEQRILWDMEALLEKEIKNIFNDNYQESLYQARLKIRDEIN